MKESAKHQGPAQQQATLINESLNLGLLAQLKEEILHSEGSEVLAQLPREAVVPHPWQASRPGWMRPWEA